MTLEEIKAAHAAGKTVCWKNVGYRVTGKNPEDLNVTFTDNGYSTGLTNRKGELQGDEADFFIYEDTTSKE